MSVYELRIPTSVFKLLEYMEHARAYILVIDKDRKDGIAFAVRSSNSVFVASKYGVDNAEVIYSIVSPLMKMPIYLTPNTGNVIIQLNEDNKQARILHYDGTSRTPILVRRVLKHNIHTIVPDVVITSEKLANVIYMNSSVLEDISNMIPKIEVLFDEVHISDYVVGDRYYMNVSFISDNVELSVKIPVYGQFVADHYITIGQFMMMYRIMPSMFNIDEKSLYFYREIGDVTTMLRLRCKHG